MHAYGEPGAGRRVRAIFDAKSNRVGGKKRDYSYKLPADTRTDLFAVTHSKFNFRFVVRIICQTNSFYWKRNHRFAIYTIGQRTYAQARRILRSRYVQTSVDRRATRSVTTVGYRSRLPQPVTKEMGGFFFYFRNNGDGKRIRRSRAIVENFAVETCELLTVRRRPEQFYLRSLFDVSGRENRFANVTVHSLSVGTDAAVFKRNCQFRRRFECVRRNRTGNVCDPYSCRFDAVSPQVCAKKTRKRHTNTRRIRTTHERQSNLYRNAFRCLWIAHVYQIAGNEIRPKRTVNYSNAIGRRRFNVLAWLNDRFLRSKKDF